MEHILGTATISADSQLLNIMSLYRSNPDQPFTESERRLKEVIFPHLIEALRKNWQANLPRLFPENQRILFNSIATCDPHGILQIAMPAFIELCRLEWPAWTGPELPEAAQEIMRTETLKFIGRKIVICMSRQDDLLLLRARPKLAVDELTARELEVAHRFATGSNYKTIALELSVSPSLNNPGAFDQHLRQAGHKREGLSDCRNQSNDAIAACRSCFTHLAKQVRQTVPPLRLEKRNLPAFT